MRSAIYKNVWLLLLCLLAAFSQYSFATNPPITKWLKNISEGEGAMPSSMDDYAPEIGVSGNLVHFLWMTNNNWATKQLTYRRSPDGGKTWDVKKLLVDNAGLDDASRYLKMYVNGNYVHIAYIVKEGLGPSELFYLRSVNGGNTFEAPVKLYSVPQSMIELRVKGYGANVTIAAVHYCHYCSDVNIIHLFSSENNGASFEDRVLPGNFNAYTFTTWDIAVEVNSVYLLLMEGVGYWADYNYNLHLMSSNNRGVTFRDQIISVPAMSGVHHPFNLMDYNWGYIQKLSTQGGKVWATWSGWDAENKERIFVAGSNDGGNTFLPTKSISGDVSSFQRGLETITVNIDEITVAFVMPDGRIFVNRSHNRGQTFGTPQEITLKDDNDFRSGWGPFLINEPSTHNAYLLMTGPVFGLLKADEDYVSLNQLGNDGIRDRRYVKAAFDPDGVMHVVFQGGRAWLSTGVFTDYDIFYRRVDPAPKLTASEDRVLKLAALQNEGNGTGDVRFDKMAIGQQKDMVFTEAMTIELWLRPELDRPATYLTHNHKGTWNQGDVGGFILWSDNYQGLLPVTNIITTTGRYPMSSKFKMKVDVWNHLAVTYDKNGGAQNFRLYLNGELAASTTAVGDIVTPDVSWILGSWGDTYYRESFQGQMDELRFWNKARSGEEIRAALYQKPDPVTPGLVAYFNFNEVTPDGQVADVTGKGHTGYLIYQEESVLSSIKNIGVRFEYVQNNTDVFFRQFSNGADQFEWNFGDTKTSTDVNPIHTYEKPGVYDVCLTATGQGNAGTYCNKVVVNGIDRIFPNSGGNKGELTLNIFGGGFSGMSQAILRKAGGPDILAKKNIYEEEGSLTTVFDFTDKTIGLYDVVVKTGVTELILSKAFTLEVAENAKPWVRYSGGGTLLIHRWTPQTITIGNSSNVDAHGVVLWVAVPKTDFDITFLNLDVQKPQLAIDRGWADELDAMGLYVNVDSLFGKPSQSKLYAFYFPYLPAKSSFDIQIRVRTTNLEKSQVQVALSAPFYASPLSTNVQACIAFAIAKALIKSGIGFIPGVPCITGTLTVISEYAEDDPPTPSSFENIDVKGFPWILGTSLLECAASLTAPVVAGVLTIITSSVEAKQEHDDCIKGFWPSPISIFQILYYPVSSLDPNEKRGSYGFTDQNYIAQNGRLPYRINFENKSTATAPAQEVTISDTLSNPLYDLDNFSFGPLGFGDEVLYPAQNAAEFGAEVDFSATKNHVVRITGKLNKETRILTWYFAALNPDTRELVTDPLGGFLPPNVNAPEGEGFVSFSLGLNEVKHGDQLRNRAGIVFDLNPAIITNEFINTFDLLPPSSKLELNTTASHDAVYRFEIEGSDAQSGVRYYEIFVSENGGAYQLDRYVGGNVFDFSGVVGKNYKLYSIAVDSVGNREDAPGQPDVDFTVSSLEDLAFGQSVLVYPIPAKNMLHVEFRLDKPAAVNCVLFDLGGKVMAKTEGQKFDTGRQKLQLDLDLANGFYLLKITADGHTAYKKVVVRN
ncbi:MAG: T9SS type A sorting domain-containing protein [Saprospiraceae bacterium]|nr:T9SS type A sorting domain-containing protein [Saprospiraceae bacterium]